MPECLRLTGERRRSSMNAKLSMVVDATMTNGQSHRGAEHFRTAVLKQPRDQLRPQWYVRVTRSAFDHGARFQ